MMKLSMLLTATLMLAGCASRETRASRERLNCIYSARYGAGIPDDKRPELVNACEEAYR